MISKSDFLNLYDYSDKREEQMMAEECQRIKEYLQMRDEEIFNSSWRLSQGYFSKDKRTRTIITKFGAVKIMRRRYYYHEGKDIKYAYLLDKQEIGLDSYERVHSHLKIQIMKLADDGKRQRDILELFKYADLSITTIGKIIRSYDLEELANPRNYQIDKVEVDDYLNIQMDDCYVDLRENNNIYNYRVRLTASNTGHDLKKSTEQRKVVANKHVKT